MIVYVCYYSNYDNMEVLTAFTLEESAKTWCYEQTKKTHIFHQYSPVTLN